tara:strand:- start:1106 stop:5233 length:4128 start_codon:yes stop_codon:yes gene_type:complete
MAQLWNKKEQRIEENVADSDVQERVFSGSYDFLGGPNANIALDLGEGSPTYVPASNAAKYIQSGATYLTPVQVRQMKENREFAESGLGALSAIATGTDQYLFAGAGSHVLEAMGIIPEGQVEAIQHASPYINHGAGLATSILGALGSFGTSAAAQAGIKGTAAATRGATAMAQKAAAQQALDRSAKSIVSKGYDATKTALSNYTLPGIGTKAALAVEKGANKWLMRQGDKLVPKRLASSEIAKRYGPAAAKITSATIGAGVEGGIWGLGEGVSEAIVGAPEESAEHILDSVGTNMLLGMALGGGVAGIVPFITGAKGAAVNIADKFLDFSGSKTSALSKKFEPYLTAVAEAGGESPESVAWLRKAALGDLDLVKELDNFQNNMAGSADKAAKLLDLLRIQRQFIEISDIQGFRLDVLEDAVQATIDGRSINYNIGSILDKDSVLKSLSKEAEQKRNEFRKALAANDETAKKKALDEIEDIKSRRKKREQEVRENEHSFYSASENPDEYKIPKKMSEVFNNVAESYARTRLALFKVLDRNPDADANNFIANAIKEINEREMSLYTDFLSDQNIAKYESQLRQELKETKLSGKEQSLIDRVKTRVGKILEQHLSTSGYRPIRDIMEAGSEFGTNPEIYYKDFTNALEEVLEFGNFEKLTELVNAVDLMPGNIGKMFKQELGISANKQSMSFVARAADGGVEQKSINFEKAREAFTKEGTIDLGESRVNGAVEEMRATKLKLKDAFNKARKLEIVKREDNRVPKTTEYLTSGPLAYTDGGSFLPIRADLESVLNRLNYSDAVFDTSLVAKAFKSVEDIQTYLLKSLEYGSVPASDTIKSVIEKDVIEMLRADMKNRSRWGQMAKLKDEFDTKAKRFNLFDQQTGKLTKQVGDETLADPKAFMTFVKNLDNANSEILLKQLNGYGRSGRDLLEMIRANFDEVGIEKPGVASGIDKNLPAQVRYGIEKKLREIDKLGVDINPSVRTVSDPHMLWDSRLKSMIDYSSASSNDLDKLLAEIKEKLPLAEAFLSTNARNENIANSISDLGRGGVLATMAYLATGSKVASAAAGAAVGASSMALNPERYLQLMYQMKVLHDANKKLISDYMKDWAENKVPKAAISKEWEKKSRSMLMVASQPYQRDTREGRTKIRKKAAQNRNVSNWSKKIEEALSSELTEENFFESSTAISQLASSKMLMDKFTKEVTKIFEQTPDIRSAMQETIERKIKIANSLIPKANTGTVFSDPIPPTTFQLQEFGRALQVLNSPKDTILTAMLSGTLTPEMVKVLANAWPQIYAEIVTEAMSAADNNRGSLTQSQKTVLATLTGASMMDASEAARLSATFAPKEDGQRGGQPGPRPGGMRQSVNALSAGTTDGTLNRQ